MTLSASDISAARADLAKIPVKAPASFAGYARDRFGAAWTDHCSTAGCDNRCDTRNDILARDLVNDIIDAKGCIIRSGTLYDPYTGTTILFTRGAGTSSAVQIDHIVSLGDAWRTGAQDISVELRTNLANDPANLVAVDGPTNGAKSDSDASEWLPPTPSARCPYVVHQVEVKITYRLWMTPAEHDAVETVLDDC